MACDPVEQSINKALRACGACVAMGAQRNVVRVDQLDGSRAFPGNLETIRFNTPKIDAQGRIAHLRGFWIVGSARITSAAVAAAVSAYNLRRLFTQVMLSDVAGWDYFRALDARSLLDDVWSRHGARIAGGLDRLAFGVEGALPVQTNDMGVPANNNATADFPITTYYPLVTLGPGHSPLEGLIPLAAIQLAPQGGMRVRFGQTADLPGAPAGVTLVDYRRLDGTVGLEVWADIVYLPVVIADEAWQLTHDRQTEQSLDLPNGDRRTEHLSIRYLPEDDAALAGQDLAAQSSGLTLQVGGNTIFAGFTNLDAQVRSELFDGSMRDSADVHDDAARALPIRTAAGNPAILQLLAFAPREASAAGTVNLQATTRTPTFWRFLHRTVQCPGGMGAAHRAAKLYAAAKCGPCAAIFGSDKRGEVTAEISSSRPLVMQPQKFAQG